jgi:sialidase-1
MPRRERFIADGSRGGSGHLLASWSEDGGRTRTLPTLTEIWGRPPHLLTLADGRLLCTFGHQRAPLGVQALVSEDGGETWDIGHSAVVADDGTSSSMGYHPMSVQLADGAIYTAYYTADADGATPYSVGVRWTLPW